MVTLKNEALTVHALQDFFKKVEIELSNHIYQNRITVMFDCNDVTIPISSIDALRLEAISNMDKLMFAEFSLFKSATIELSIYKDLNGYRASLKKMHLDNGNIIPDSYSELNLQQKTGQKVKLHF
ncbi:MAG: hypothetical protein ACK4WD_02240 [Flavobacteriales bacterium]